MDDVFRHVDARSAKLAGHPLFTWLKTAPIPPARRLQILPVLAPLAMACRDICTWVLPYPSPQDDLQAAINVRAASGLPHCTQYLADWDALGLDEKLGWRFSDLLWWLFLAPETEAIRRARMQLLAMAAADSGDPLLRCAWSDAIDACNSLFFGATAPVADQVARRTGLQYRYLGNHRLAQTSRHPVYAAAFTGHRLTGSRQAQAVALADSVIDTFESVFSSLLEYGTAYPAAGQIPHRPAAVAAAGHAGGLPRRSPQTRPVNAAIQGLLDEWRADTAGHPLYEWLRSSQAPAAAERLAILLPEWAMGIMGYHDLCTYAFPCQQEADTAADVNTWAGKLAGHSAAFLADWEHLGLDERSGWTASQALHWLYVDPRMDAHRHTMVQAARMAAGCVSPLARMWLLEALEASGQAWFAAAMEPAEEVERGTGGRLDYLAGRCEITSPDDGRFRQQRLSTPECEQVAHMIAQVFDGMHRQLDLSMARVQRPAPRVGGAGAAVQAVPGQ